jgi:hypothetical protein
MLIQRGLRSPAKPASVLKFEASASMIVEGHPRIPNDAAHRIGIHRIVAGDRSSALAAPISNPQLVDQKFSPDPRCETTAYLIDGL